MKVSSTRSEKVFWIVVTILVYSLKFTGIAPFTIRTKTLTKNNRSIYFTRVFVFSKIGLAYNIFLSILYPVMAVITIPLLFSMDYENLFLLTEATDVYLGVFCICTAWVIIIYWTLKQRNATCIMNKLSKVYVRLSGMKKQPSAKGLFKFIAIHVTMNFCLWITICVMDIIHPVISELLVNWCVFNLPSFVINWFILEYFMILGLLAEEIKNLNKNLLDFNEFEDHLSRSPFLNDYLVVWSSSFHGQLIDTLRLLRNIRTSLFELSRDIADFFSFPILLCIAYCFFSLISNVYYLVTLIMIRDGTPTLSYMVTTVTWILTTVYPLFLLFFNVTETVTAAKLTGRVLNKLMSVAIKPETRTVLQQFSIQLLHENFNFTAYGFFTLDFTLLHSMLAATASYIFILIQFQ